MKNGSGSVAEGETGPAECTLELTDADFLDMCTGKADPMKLFTGGKLKITGNVMASQKLEFLKKVDPNDVVAAMKARAGKGGAAAAPAVSAEPTLPTSARCLRRHCAYITKNPDSVGKVKTVFAFKLKNPDSVWTLDLKNGNGSVAQGETGPAECTLELTDADFLDMCTGKADPMKLFTGGKLKITGNIMASQKLEFLKKVDPADVLAAMKARTGGGGSAPAAKAQPAAAEASSATSRSQGRQGFRGVRGAGQAPRGKSRYRQGRERGHRRQGQGPERHLHHRGQRRHCQVKPGAVANADTTVTISDADLYELAEGKATSASLYQHGKLRVDGAIPPVRHLDLLTKLKP